MKKILRPIVAVSIFASFLSCETDNSEVANEEIVTAEAESKASSWSMVFEDNFNSNSNINDQWTRTSGRTDYNSSICHYKSWLSNLATIDGNQCLRLEAKKYNDNEYRAGHVKSHFSYKPNNNEEYRLRAKIKLIAKDGSNWKGFGETYGAWPAFWTVEENEWPTRGEIDIMEGYSKAPANPHFASNLFYGTSIGNNQLGNSCENEYDVSEGWHTYEMRWKRSANGWVSVHIYLDGEKQRTYTNNANNNLNLKKFGPHNIILNLNVGSDNGIFNNSNINLFSTTYMYVDYVKLQKRTL